MKESTEIRVVVTGYVVTVMPRNKINGDAAKTETLTKK